MNRKRDAETGQYISDEEALERDPATWVEETEFDKGAFLEKIFESLMYKSFGLPTDGRVVKISDIQKLFAKYKKEISPENVFNNRLEKILEGLTYESERDAKVLPFRGGKVSNINSETVLALTNHSPGVEVEEINFKELFDKLGTVKDWYSEYEIRRVEKYVLLRDLLENHLNDIKVFKVGNITKDVYIVGRDPEGNLQGVHTVVVET